MQLICDCGFVRVIESGGATSKTKFTCASCSAEIEKQRTEAEKLQNNSRRTEKAVAKNSETEDVSENQARRKSKPRKRFGTRAEMLAYIRAGLENKK